ncbi:methyltransferase domain-containing protein [Streptomyces sp. MB22_4]|uniref:methyltransferase domain-containing protein n=1 Tax=Streptomyces sp. MB22_4 TaxID=3383120 RepID=UPI0039A235EF
MPTSPLTWHVLFQRGFYESHLENLRHRLTARALSALPEPEAWLDVGTGDGRFPEAAKRFFPYTSFDGLDPTDRVARALAEGRVEEAHRGHLTTPGVVTRLRSRYDVVSLFGPPASAPAAELAAAFTVVRPGGHVILGHGWSPADVDVRACTVLGGARPLPFLHHHRIVARRDVV